ncbi:hypothetical protein F8388_007070 [Cannabis sativa]|uniref:Uncharacterized protein n=1 Tax=Cannabis sativa TaxID=3483 RepID=A0A7J6F1C0_CANSA|nr:hypothetical protein F8388_007070 [Cannabis sativa]KAF4366696.1 hypothetical protein G4B88_010771 [Cannabis sativa]
METSFVSYFATHVTETKTCSVNVHHCFDPRNFYDERLGLLEANDRPGRVVECYVHMRFSVCSTWVALRLSKRGASARGVGRNWKGVKVGRAMGIRILSLEVIGICS